MSQPGFNQFITSNAMEEYDALIFYDMWQEISETEKDAYIKLLEEGIGMIFLHHSLVSYQHWDEFQQIIGGKYIEQEYSTDPKIKPSSYYEDITLDIKIVNKNHPVTRGITDFSILDESYQNIEVLAGINPLLSTIHTDCTPVVAWANHYKKSNIIYILLGHGRHAYEDSNYRKLIRNAISWVSKW
jgi:type 1 glutamine amidotransferase